MLKVLRYSKQTTKRIALHGVLNTSANQITYTEDEETFTVSVQELFNKFAGERINLIILSENNEQLSIK